MSNFTAYCVRCGRAVAVNGISDNGTICERCISKEMQLNTFVIRLADNGMSAFMIGNAIQSTFRGKSFYMIPPEDNNGEWEIAIPNVESDSVYGIWEMAVTHLPTHGVSIRSLSHITE